MFQYRTSMREVSLEETRRTVELVSRRLVQGEQEGAVGGISIRDEFLYGKKERSQYE